MRMSFEKLSEVTLVWQGSQFGGADLLVQLLPMLRYSIHPYNIYRGIQW